MFLAQLFSVEFPVGTSNATAGGTSSLIWVWVTLIALVLVISGLWFMRYVLHRKHHLPRAFGNVVLQVLLPKESWRKDLEGKDWRETLGGFETLFVTLGSLKVPGSAWQKFWYGENRHVALEIVAQQGQIRFYLAVPRAVQQLIELQIQAQYPHAHIEEVHDYNLFQPQIHIQATSLKMSKPSYFPLRTYKRLDSDPLYAIANVLSKVQPQEGAAIQMLIQPKPAGWQRPGRQMARRLQEGEHLQSAGTSGMGGFITASLASGPRRPPAGYGGVPNITPMEQDFIRVLEEKSSKPGFDVNIRVVAASPLERNARVHLDNIVNAFSQFTSPESGNSLKRGAIVSSGSLITDFIYRHFRPADKIVLNSEELNSLYHFPLPDTPVPTIQWLAAKQAAAPPDVPTEGIVLGRNRYRGQETVVRLQTSDRRRHVYIIGVTGSGKSVLMAEMAKQDILAGHGLCVVDPHGSLVEEVLAGIPPERMHDVVLFDPSDVDRPMGLNMLEARTPEERDFAVQEMIAIFMKLFPPEMIGPMFEHNMRNAMLTLMADEENPGTIADIPRMFTDKAFQQYKVAKVTDPVVRSFWEKEMAKTSDFHKSEMLGYLISKVGRFVENSMMRNIIGQPRSGFNVRELMDKRKILLVNLSKGKVGEVNAALLGLIIVSKLQLAALSRADQPEEARPDFYLYLDEFQNFITDSIATILSEARKYRLNLTLAHQYMGQLSQGSDTRIRDAVLGNVGTMVAFRIGVEDADILEKQFAPTFSAFDLVNQERFTAYVRLLINNTVARPFQMTTNPPSPGSAEMAQAIREYSRLRFGQDRRVVESEILRRTQLGAAPVNPPAPAELPPRESSR